ncbi:uncharacterized protein LOC116302890 [Actinia tenebrosa]|uniref:Uncharacterized protein LOC116302890 n=1 Tax=Actinia tenebrosa TaxID=6105 RepID=A0A6P8IP52_ACTTE|nr:uncharacterized protein LOC116302890 [Actinia tenebrosa]
MYISSMYKKQPYGRDSPYNWRPLPSRGTKKRNPDEDFILRGKRPAMSLKDSGYRTNTDMTIRPSNTSKSLTRAASAPSVRFPDYEVTAEEFDPRDLTLDLSDFDDQPCEELMRLQDDGKFLNQSANSDWFLNPIHRTKSPPVNLDKLSETHPLKASVLKSTAQGNITSEFSEDIRKTPVNAFDLSIFRNAEEEMLYSRTLSGLSTPYRENLARLKIERLKLEEERMIKKKCMNELERIRGPKPRWYELKTPDFHREAKKNNDILYHSGYNNELLAYRNQLLETLGEEKCPSQQESMHKFYHSKSHNKTM